MATESMFPEVGIMRELDTSGLDILHASDGDIKLPPLGVRTTTAEDVREQSMKTANLTGKLQLKRKTKHEVNNLLMETWLHDVLSGPTLMGEDIDLNGTRFATDYGLQRFGLSRSQLTSKGLLDKQVDRLYRSLYVYTVGFHDLLRELFGHSKSSREHVVNVWQGVMAVSERALKVQFRSEFVELVQEQEFICAHLQEARCRIIELEGHIGQLQSRIHGLKEEKAEVERERGVYQGERETLVSSLEAEERTNHHTMQKYTLEIEHRTELQRQVIKMRSGLSESTRERNEATELIRNLRKEHTATLTALDELTKREKVMNDSLIHVKTEKSNLERKLKQLEKRNDEYRSKAEISTERYQQEVKTKIFLQGEVHSKREKVAELEAQERKLKLTLNNTEEDKRVSESLLRELTKTNKVITLELETEKNRVTNADTLSEKLLSDITSYKNEVSNWTKKCEQMEEAHAHIVAANEAVIQERSQFADSLARCQEDLRATIARENNEGSTKRKLTVGMAVLFQEVQWLQKLSAMRGKKATEYGKKVTYLESELRRSQNKVKALTSSGETVRQQLSTAEMKILSMESSVEDFNAKSRELKEANSQLDLSLAGLKIEHEAALLRGREHFQRAEGLAADLDTAREDLKRKMTTISNMEGQHFKSQDQIRALESDLKNTMEEAKQYKREYEKVEVLQHNTADKLKALQKEHDKFEALSIESLEKIEELSKQLSETMAKLSAKRAKKKSWKEKYENKAKDFEAKESELEAANDNITEGLDRESTLRDHLSDEKRGRAEDRENFLKQIEDGRLELEMEEKAHEGTKGELRDEKQTVSDRLADIAELEDKLQNLQKECEDLQATVDLTSQTKTFLQKEISEIKIKDYDIEQHSNRVEEENNELKDKLQSLKTAHTDALDKQKAKLDKQISQLNKKLEENQASRVAEYDCLRESSDVVIAEMTEKCEALSRELEATKNMTVA